MLTKSLNAMVAVVMLTGAVAAQELRWDLPLNIYASSRDADQENVIYTGAQVHLQTQVERSGVAAFAVSPDDSLGPLSLQGTVFLGFQIVGDDGTADWFGQIPPSLAGYTLRLRAAHVDKYQVLHMSQERNIKIELAPESAEK